MSWIPLLYLGLAFAAGRMLGRWARRRRLRARRRARVVYVNPVALRSPRRERRGEDTIN